MFVDSAASKESAENVRSDNGCVWYDTDLRRGDLVACRLWGLEEERPFYTEVNLRGPGGRRQYYSMEKTPGLFLGCPAGSYSDKGSSDDFGEAARPVLLGYKFSASLNASDCVRPEGLNTTSAGATSIRLRCMWLDCRQENLRHLFRL